MRTSMAPSWGETRACGYPESAPRGLLTEKRKGPPNPPKRGNYLGPTSWTRERAPSDGPGLKSFNRCRASTLIFVAWNTMKTSVAFPWELRVGGRGESAGVS